MGFDRTSGYEHRDVTLAAMQDIQKDVAQELKAERETAKEAMQKEHEEMGGELKHQIKGHRKDRKHLFGEIKTHLVEKPDKNKESEMAGKKAAAFEKKNPELKGKTLLLLRQQIGNNMSREEILKKVEDFYEDPALADEAMEFLEQTTDGELQEKCKDAKQQLNEKNGREIAAGRNIGELSRQTEGLGTPTTLRQLYKDITGNPREPNTLFEELSEQYTYKDLQKVIKFLFHALGTDMKSKGPSIPRGQLHRLLSETRTLQAILGVYRFFKGRMNLMEKLFAKEGLKMPQKLSFELMSKQFMKLVSERYPSSEKILKQMDKYGVEKWIIGKIIVLSQMRDGIREVAMNQIYKSLQHRDELQNAIIEALEDLEDEWEEYEEDEDEDREDEWEEEEEEEEDKKKQGKGKTPPPQAPRR